MLYTGARYMNNLQFEKRVKKIARKQNSVTYELNNNNTIAIEQRTSEKNDKLGKIIAC